MKKNQFLWIMIVIVAGIWTYNIYKTVENQQVSQELLEEQIQTSVWTPTSLSKDSFVLELPTLDPFLKKQSYPSKEIQVSNPIHPKKSQTSENIPIKSEKKWPTIQYLGFVQNLDQGTRLCLVQIEGQLKKIKVNESFLDVRIEKAWRDSIRVIFNSEQRIIRKN